MLAEKKPDSARMNWAEFEERLEREKMSVLIKKIFFTSISILFFTAQAASATDFLVGFQTFLPCVAGNQNSGICDDAPQSNGTYDDTPVGSTGPGNVYLTAVIGPDASSVGRKGRGQQRNNQFLNGEGFGNEVGNSERFIVNVPNASDGSLPGTRFGAYDTTPLGAPNGTSSWKFSSTGNEREGDIRIVNHSDYYFRLEFLNFDARVGNANSPQTLTIRYLAGDGTTKDNNLTKKSDGQEVADLKGIYDNGFGPGPVVGNVSRSLGEVTETQVYIPPGGAAGFRFIWDNFGAAGAESQLDNIAFQGKFFETADLTTEIDPTAVPGAVPGLGAGLGLFLASAMGVLGLLKVRRRATTA